MNKQLSFITPEKEEEIHLKADSSNCNEKNNKKTVIPEWLL